MTMEQFQIIGVLHESRHKPREYYDIYKWIDYPICLWVPIKTSYDTYQDAFNVLKTWYPDSEWTLTVKVLPDSEWELSFEERKHEPTYENGFKDGEHNVIRGLRFR